MFRLPQLTVYLLTLSQSCVYITAKNCNKINDDNIYDKIKECGKKGKISVIVSKLGIAF
jgi:hypothetical protein